MKDPAIALFHQNTMVEAQKQAQSLSKLSKYKSLYFSLDPESFNDLCAVLEDFSTRIKAEYYNDFIRNKRLYKFNFQLYPITDVINPSASQLAKREEFVKSL